MPPKKTDAPAKTPVPPPSKSGRQRTLTNKQQQLVAQQTEKEDVAKKRALLDAVRSEQRIEEINGFRKRKLPDLPPDEDDFEPGPESEDDDEPMDPHTAFSSVTVAPVVKTTVRNGRTLVHRVQHADQAVSSGPQPVAVSVSSASKNLIRRAAGDPTSYPPMLPLQHKPANANRPGPYTPPVQARYGRGDGTFYSSHPGIGVDELADEEFDAAVPVVNYREPMVYDYPDAHPALETFPRSSRSPHAVPQAQGSTKSSSPSGPKRKEPPTTTSAETTVVVKRVKVEGSGSRGRVRTADFDELTRSVIEETISIYRAQIGGVEPFPERADDRDTVKQAWVEVCSGRNLRIELEEDIFKLVVSRASQARGYAKTTSKPYFLSGHNIDSLGSKREVRDHVEQLLEGARFIYKDPAAKTGIFRAPLVQVLVNKIWFKNKEDDGAIHPEFSENDMLPAATMAFVHTLIENDLDEWVTGEHVDVPFTAAAYKAKYRVHLKRIKDFETKTQEADIMPRLLRHMLKAARKHAKVSEAGVAPVVHVSDAEIEAAKQEWEGLVLSDDE